MAATLSAAQGLADDPARRADVRFQKRYDPVERVLPDAHARPEPSTEAHLEWACSTALERLGAARWGSHRT